MVTSSDKNLSRVAIVQILYMFKLSDSDIHFLNEEKIEQYTQQLITFYAQDPEEEGVSVNKIRENFVKAIVMYIAANVDLINQKIVDNLSNKQSWQRMHVLIKAILRAAIAESVVLHTKKNIVINEYVGITSSFFSAKEVSFVNASLDRILTSVE